MPASGFLRRPAAVRFRRVRETPASGFFLIQILIGFLEQALYAFALAVIDGGADASRDRRVLLIGGQSFADAGSHALGLILASLGKHDSEFVSAIACSRVDGAAMDAQDVGDAAESAAADEVAVGIVNSLEAVQIEQQHRKGTAGAQGALRFRVQNIKKFAVVGEAGQRVAGREVADLFENARAVEQRTRQQNNLAGHIHQLCECERAIEQSDGLTRSKLSRQVQPDSAENRPVERRVGQILAMAVAVESQKENHRRNEMERVWNKGVRVTCYVRGKLAKGSGDQVGQGENSKQRSGNFEPRMPRTRNEMRHQEGNSEEQRQKETAHPPGNRGPQNPDLVFVDQLEE